MTVTEQSPGPSTTITDAVTLEDVTVTFGQHPAVRHVTMTLRKGEVTALIGPSGCGKTTVLRTVNRMHDHAGGKVQGQVRIGDLDVYGGGVSPEEIRSRVGMVFQKPNPFPSMSIYENAISGLRMAGVRKKNRLHEAAERVLHQAALWDIVKDRLDQPAVRLSGGQQQRLCIARALAVEPEVLLMDEPCSALDPVATAKIEDLIRRLVPDVTVALVTHNMFQAHRVSQHVAVFLLDEARIGHLAETGPTTSVFDSPTDSGTREYLSGHIG